MGEENHLPEEFPPAGDDDEGLPDYEMPTRRIDPVEADSLGMTQASTTAPDSLPPWRDEIPPRTYRDPPPPVPPASPSPIYGGYSDRPHVRQRRRSARQRRDSGLYLPWWSLLIMLAVVAFFAALLVLGANLLGGQFTPGGETPVVIVITATPTPRPTDTPLPSPSPFRPLATATPITFGGNVETPADAATPPGASPDLRVGVTVEVVEVGLAGLNVRQGAGTSFARLFIAPEGTQFVVIGGPQEADGFTWWQVRGVEDSTRQGWVVQDFLAAVTP